MLRDLPLKLEYRSDVDDILRDFFYPCLEQCSLYYECINKFSLDMLMSLIAHYKHFAAGDVVMKIVMGYRLDIKDINTLANIYSGNISNSKNADNLRVISNLLQTETLRLRVAITDLLDENSGFERTGIIGDSNGDYVVFINAGKELFHKKYENFEIVDVFTSWSDTDRANLKMKMFDQLWNNELKHAQVYDYDYATKYNILKYDLDWVIND